MVWATGRLLTVNLPLEPIEVGTVVQRAAWPLHVTLLPNAVLDSGMEEVSAAVLRFAEHHAPVTATASGEATFGVTGDLHVDLIESDELRRMHADVVQLLGAGGRLHPVDPGHFGPGYRPHVTRTRTQHAPGHFTLGTIVLAELEPSEHGAGVAVVLVAAPLTGRG